MNGEYWVQPTWGYTCIVHHAFWGRLSFFYSYVLFAPTRYTAAGTAVGTAVVGGWWLVVVVVVAHLWLILPGCSYWHVWRVYSVLGVETWSLSFTVQMLYLCCFYGIFLFQNIIVLGTFSTRWASRKGIYIAG